MSTAVKRACDACHRRKVKCDGINPCRNCSSAQLSCTYNAIPQKKGPKGSRAKVISELRETQRATSLSAKVQSRLNGIHSPPCAPSLSPNTGLMSTELVKETIDFFFANMYPIMPILNRQRLEQQAMYMDQSLDTYCLLTSMSAFMLLQPGMNVPGGDPLFEHPGANIASSQLLMEETMRVRKGYEYAESPTLNSLCTSYFLFGCCYALELHDKAWFHLREATTLAHIIGMTQEEKYMQFDGVESSRRRRLYWLLFVTERAYALKNGRPVTLTATINLPSLTDDPTDNLAHQLNGYILLVNLFRSFDDTFLLLWNKTRNECSPSYLGALQKQLAGLHPPYMNGSDAQFNDMRSNQQWLKTVSWHLSLQNGVPHNGEELAYQYPLDPSRDLISITSQFQTQNTDLLGVPLVAKLLDIASALTDVLSMQPTGDPFSVGPQQHLQSLLQLLNLLRNGEHHFMPLLLSKVHDIVPRLVNPMLQRTPENVVNIDIFDGFGNAGMAQPPVMSEFKPEPFKPESFTPGPVAQRVEDMVTDSGSSNGGAPGADMNSPFPLVSSPSVMSPGMEFPQHHMGEFSSIPDMVMGSLGPSSQGSLGNQGSPLGQQNQHQPHQPHQQPQHQQQQPQQQHQQQQQHQPHHGFPAQGMTPNPSMHNQQMPSGVHPQINHSIAAQQPMNGMHPPSHGHNPSFSPMGQGHMNQNMVNNMMHRQQPQRANSMVMHQPQQIRTVGDFHALQRANSETVTMGTMAMSPLGAEMDFSGLR